MNVLDQIHEHIGQHIPAKYVRFILMGLTATVLIGFSFAGYHLYQRHQEQYAQELFAAGIKEYEKALGMDEEYLWKEVAETFALGYKKSSGSALSPFFLGFQADALIHLNQHAEALEIMDEMLKKLPKSSPLYYLYATKAALIRCDSSDESIKELGLSALKQLAQQPKNWYKDLALYYCGYFAWLRHDQAEAQEWWSKLSGDLETGSPWAQQAFSLLEHKN
jgi:predicted Zn-dependent protease